MSEYRLRSASPGAAATAIRQVVIAMLVMEEREAMEEAMGEGFLRACNSVCLYECVYGDTNVHIQGRYLNTHTHTHHTHTLLL